MLFSWSFNVTVTGSDCTTHGSLSMTGPPVVLALLLPVLVSLVVVLSDLLCFSTNAKFKCFN